MPMFEEAQLVFTIAKYALIAFGVGVIPPLFWQKRKQLKKQAEAEALKKKKIEEVRIEMLKFFRSSTTLNDMKINERHHDE